MKLKERRKSFILGPALSMTCITCRVETITIGIGSAIGPAIRLLGKIDDYKEYELESSKAAQLIGVRFDFKLVNEQPETVQDDEGDLVTAQAQLYVPEGESGDDIEQSLFEFWTGLGDASQFDRCANICNSCLQGNTRNLIISLKTNASLVEAIENREGGLSSLVPINEWSLDLSGVVGN